MALDHISATVIYVMWREGYLWNDSVLKKAHLSNLASYILLFKPSDLLHFYNNAILFEMYFSNMSRKLIPSRFH